MFSSSSSDDSDKDIIFQILINLPRPRLFRDWSNPLQDYDDLDHVVDRNEGEGKDTAAIGIDGYVHDREDGVARFTGFEGGALTDMTRGKRQKVRSRKRWNDSVKELLEKIGTDREQA
ncbi:putative nuclease HARBI1 [Aphis craccivora]|uniref:Putative nuclease HARBI1 n=1 Tax=Aphis craccivora TaxID=307492 RepID=A0A6G0ZRY1_APHCR|nr:putative nuclease HARBI1 [Aphis craccivora]